MSTVLQRIEIQNFKAFRDFTLDVGGRHLLVYGPNGSGKSSLYWAIYTFLQSGRKDSIAKYFDVQDKESLLNIHENAIDVPGQIGFTLRDTNSDSTTTFRISFNLHETRNEPIITRGELASDFITYRFLFGFSHFRNSQTFDVWPLFEKEILPFCATGNGFNLGDEWSVIKSAEANLSDARGSSSRFAYDAFKNRTDEFAGALVQIVDDISNRAQVLYNDNFAGDDQASFELKLMVTQKPQFTGSNKQNARFIEPVLEFGIKLDGQRIEKPQSFLNEAKLTQLALSIRLAAALVNLQESDLKLLVLDDLLVSLDMSNRMRVVKMLNTPEFDGYQKIILTHEIGLFQELKRHIGTGHQAWQFARLSGNARANLKLFVVKSDLQIAVDYLANDEIAECGNRLRKAAEEILERFLIAAKGEHPEASLIERGSFQSLTGRISEAKGLLLLQAKSEFAAFLQGAYSSSEFEQIVSEAGVDPSSVEAANNQERGQIIGKLIGARANFETTMLALLSDAARKQRNASVLLEEVDMIKDRILNPASHAGVTPLFTSEAEDAIKIIRELKTALDAVLPTLS